jgi:hypothetical protein
MRLLKKSGFFEKTKTTTLIKFSLLLFLCHSFFGLDSSLHAKKLHFISSNNKGFV